MHDVFLNMYKYIDLSLYLIFSVNYLHFFCTTRYHFILQIVYNPKCAFFTFLEQRACGTLHSQNSRTSNCSDKAPS